MSTTDKTRADALTDRDYDLHEHEQGLYRKFDVRRVGGSSEPVGKHHDCEYFVLDMMHDQHARAALRAYADACASTHPELSADLIARYGLSPVEQPAAAPIDEPVAAWINYPVKTVDGEFAGYEKPELSFTCLAYGYDITMAEPLYRRAGAPAAAPVENAELASMTRMFHAACHDLGLINEALGLDPEDGGAEPILDAINELKVRAEQPAMTPAPADERAAFAEWCERFPEISRVERLRDAWNTARASSANETGAEGTQQLSTEIRELKAKLGSYEREREDQIRYLAAQSEEIAGFKQQLAQAAEPVAIPDEATFQRLFTKHGGPVDGEGWCINESGLRDFLRELSGTSQPVTIHQVIHQVWVEESSSWADVTPAYYAERQPSNRRRVYYAPQPAQADARDEDAYVAKRLSEALADVYTTLIGDDAKDEDENLNAIERVERAAQVLRLEVELYRGQADAREGLTDEQRESVEHAATWLARSEDLQNKAHAKRLRALLQGSNHA